jgi:hypothetical protein
MMNHLNSISTAACLPSFVTLTFPDECFNDSVTEFSKWAKTQLDKFLKRLGRVAPKAAAIWKLEWQSRKSGQHEGKLFPHFHLMVWGLETRDSRVFCERTGKNVPEAFVIFQDDQLAFEHLNLTAVACNAKEMPSGDAACAAVKERGEGWSISSRTMAFMGESVKGSNRFKKSFENVARDVYEGTTNLMSFFDWVSLAWYHVVESHNLKHFLAGASVEQVRSWGGVLSYCSKYMAKLGEHGFLESVPVGRSWGIFNRADIPWAKMVKLDLDEETGVRLRRIARRYLERARGKRRVFSYGFTLYCNVEQWKKLWPPPPVNSS